MLDAITVVAVVDDDVWVTLPKHALGMLRKCLNNPQQVEEKL